MIFNRLKRLEAKIDHISTRDKDTNHDSQTATITQTTAVTQSSLEGNPTGPQPTSCTHFPNIHRTTSGTGSSHRDTKISFSTLQAPLYWLGLHSAQSPNSFTIGSVPLCGGPGGLGAWLPDAELDGPAFPGPVESAQFPGDWLATLSLSAVKGLSNTYFNTFNRIFPFIDRDYYFHNTLSTVVGGGFNDDIESCLVLSVMALGCLGANAFEEGGYHNEDILPSTGLIQSLRNQDLPGKNLFDESRRRIGLCSCTNDIQVSQYYLTAALFYSQAMRPVDQWIMTDRASTSCLIFWTHLRNRADPWTCDMQSRVFWSALLIETVVAQELDFQSSRLRELEDVVPLPMFIAYPNLKKPRSSQRDESYYDYHFLAQIAHRIILMRIRDEMYHLNPSTMVANELRHQLEQWHTSLPPALRFDDKHITFSCPAEAYAMSLLQTRYRSAIYHLGRPFLYKALANPSSVTDQELNFCSAALQNASNWPIATGACRKMISLSPLKYFVCRSFVGTLGILHALKQSHDDRLIKTLPKGSDAECSHMLGYIDTLASMNPSLQKDREVFTSLYGPTDH